MAEQRWLEESYDAFERIEEEFAAELDVDLAPQGPELLYELVAGLGLAPGAAVLDAGCGRGVHARNLAERFGFDVIGIDPVPRYVEQSSRPPTAGRLRFEAAGVEALPVPDESLDLVWCRDVLLHVADLDGAYREFRRVLRPGAHAVVYQSAFATDRLEPREAREVWGPAHIAPESSDPVRVEAVIAAAGLTVERQLQVGLEWSEWWERQTGSRSRRLRHLNRLRRDPERYVERFGRPAYDLMLADCLWHVYHMLGKLDARVYLLSRPAAG